MMTQTLLRVALLALGLGATLIAAAPPRQDQTGLSPKELDLLNPETKVLRPIKRKKSTEELLRHMGMAQVRGPNHHRKRLAYQSRKSHNDKRTGDSHVYVIRLPPNKFYYDEPHNKASHREKIKHSEQNFNRIPLDFKSNGKPGKIYHWNLPEIKKMVSRKTVANKPIKRVKAEEGDEEINQVFKSDLWPRDDTVGSRDVSFFKPKKPSKQAFHKYFPGNGKPHTLYVLDRSQQSPVSVQRIFT